MANMTAKLAIAAALVATAGCAKKRPEVLPPAPAETAPTATPQPTDNSNMVQPGSAQDFKQTVIDDTIHFALDAYDIDPEARRILDSQAQWLVKYPNTRITIEGHADERGTREYNLALGDRLEARLGARLGDLMIRGEHDAAVRRDDVDKVIGRFADLGTNPQPNAAMPPLRPVLSDAHADAFDHNIGNLVFVVF